MTQFSELPICAPIMEQLSAGRFTTMTPVQAAAIPHALEGKDVMATAQTGTGKTLAFLIPVMEQLLKQYIPGITALVLVPTRELAMQVAAQYDALRGKRLPAAALVVGGMPERQQLMSLRGGARLMVATPGRLEDFLDRKLVDFRGLSILILDEADRMLDMGFLPSIRRIVSVLPAKRQTMCFSATLPDAVEELAKKYMRSAVRVALGSTSKPSENVRMQAFEVSNDRKQDVLNHLLSQESGRCLIFVRTKHGTERLARRLTRDGFSASMIHGDRSQSQRTTALTAFQQGRIQVLVATDLASRGIHVQDIAHVINYDLPAVAEDFIHRVGRTGRNGGVGVASTLFGREQAGELRSIERSLGIRIERKQPDFDSSAKPASTKSASGRARKDDANWEDGASFDQKSSSKSSPSSSARSSSSSSSSGKMIRLPGETLQMHVARA